MPTKKRGSGSRDLGLNHGAGKGDANRSDPALIRKRFPKSMKGNVKGFEQCGRRLVKVYGARGVNDVHLRPVVAGMIRVPAGSVEHDLAVAQKLADDTNASLRAAGYDTQGH